jgi:hypothetical protein
MKKSIVVVLGLMLAVAVCQAAHAQSAQGVYRALKKVEVTASSGLPLAEIKLALRDASLAFELYKKSDEARQKRGIFWQMEKAMGSYRLAVSAIEVNIEPDEALDRAAGELKKAEEMMGK